LTINKRHLYFALLLAGVISFGSGLVDVDWMFMQYHNFGADAAPNDLWYFKPPNSDGSGGIGMNWWDAYVYTIGRIAIGMLLIGYTLSKLRVARSDH
jgi:hypothetical protein